jgi:hypothetical protein
MPGSAWGHTSIINSPAPFKVEIALDKASLEGEFYKSQGGFYLDTKVTNISYQEQEIVAWTQYGWSWISSSPQISPGIEALNNVKAQVILKPGQTYDRKVEMFSSSHRLQTFRLGFAAKVEVPVSGQSNGSKGERIFWSNPVTLKR